jgi:hypothetical protein
MTDAIEKARILIETTRSRCKMYASCRETYIMRISTALEMAMGDFDLQAFYHVYVPTRGSVYLTLKDPVDQAWADMVAKGALALLSRCS